ncbi:hypothetical protein AV530_005485 [Patagioenas fasciata monilis]|uniref:Uncharacterized protein n=1 Tax=Patagioenas fasciata monilis TaxID=372326 RepID=A0A1V4JLZ1_PATFA|nr:hypothetical protein AV530_005485 [Patagioenas fasciata monilis]
MGAGRGGERGADWLRGVAGGVFPGLGGGLRFGHFNFVCERERRVFGRQVKKILCCYPVVVGCILLIFKTSIE